MPCRCDFMEPTAKEIEYSKIIAITEEMYNGNGLLPDYYGTGHVPPYYKNSLTQAGMDKVTAELCAIFKSLQADKISKYSLEAQMWWREHQRKDAKRKAEEEENKRCEGIKAAALAKLTDEERKALNL